MSVGLTLEIGMVWRDTKLNYLNIFESKDQLNESRVIPDEEVKHIWIPIPKVRHENAVIGKVKDDANFEVKIVGLSMPAKMGITESLEELVYPGTQNDLYMTQITPKSLDCEFSKCFRFFRKFLQLFTF